MCYPRAVGALFKPIETLGHSSPVLTPEDGAARSGGTSGDAGSNEKISKQSKERYWKANISLLWKLLAVWFVVSYGAGIIFVDVLDAISLFGIPLGFWFAQQGAIYVFVVLIFYYTARMKRIDREHQVEEDDS